MKCLLLFAYLLASVSSFSQIDKYNLDSLTFEQCQVLTQIFDGYETRNLRRTIKLEVEREIVDDYYEAKFHLTDYLNQNSIQSPFSTFQGDIFLIFKDDKVIYSRHEFIEILYKVSFLDTAVSHKNSWLDKKEFQILKASYGEMYQTELNIDSMFNSRPFVYGDNCGVGGSQPYLRKLMNEKIAKNDSKSLSKWLRSHQVEKQLYGLEGILILKASNDIPISETDQRIIKFLKIKKGFARTCSGCSYENEKISKIVKEIISDYSK